jgi:hypothetical protein
MRAAAAITRTVRLVGQSLMARVVDQDLHRPGLLTCCGDGAVQFVFVREVDCQGQDLQLPGLRQQAGP